MHKVSPCLLLMLISATCSTLPMMQTLSALTPRAVFTRRELIRSIAARSAFPALLHYRVCAGDAPCCISKIHREVFGCKEAWRPYEDELHAPQADDKSSGETTSSIVQRILNPSTKSNYTPQPHSSCSPLAHDLTHDNE
jgi:hypothetical protein